MKKKFLEQEPPKLNSLDEANALIQELWGKLRDYEDKLAANSKNLHIPIHGDHLITSMPIT